MKLLIQRVKHASVSVDGECVGKIGEGFLVLVGVSDSDTKETAGRMLDKMMKLRIFADENGKTNLSIGQVGGELLLISQFTLYADCRHGNRPGFTRAGSPEHAEALYEYLISEAKKQVGVVEQGVFGADMKVELLNDGPFTVMLDSDELITK